MAQQLLDQDVEMRHGPPRQGDIRKVQSVLGWQPEVDLRDGLRETWNWFQSQVTQIAWLRYKL